MSGSQISEPCLDPSFQYLGKGHPLRVCAQVTIMGKSSPNLDVICLLRLCYEIGIVPRWVILLPGETSLWFWLCLPIEGSKVFEWEEDSASPYGTSCEEKQGGKQFNGEYLKRPKGTWAFILTQLYWRDPLIRKKASQISEKEHELPLEDRVQAGRSPFDAPNKLTWDFTSLFQKRHERLLHCFEHTSLTVLIMWRYLLQPISPLQVWTLKETRICHLQKRHFDIKIVLPSKGQQRQKGHSDLPFYSWKQKMKVLCERCLPYNRRAEKFLSPEVGDYAERNLYKPTSFN